MALVDFFLKLDGIPGDSRDAHHKDEIDLESFSWGETNAVVRPGTGGTGSGKVQLEDLNVVMKLNKASPLLLKACASGQHIKEAVLTARRAVKQQLEFLVIKMSDVLVSSYQTGGGVSSEPIDHVAFNFGRIELEFRSQNPEGSAGPPIRGGWDVKTGKSI
jgi:type VI secretion system secreted protein Hcp